MVAPEGPAGWVEREFGALEAPRLRRELPQALARAQRQGSNAHDGYDPENTELYVYGVAMSRADHDQIREALGALAAFSTVRPEGAKREVMLVNGKVILPLRVGTKMPRHVDRIRLKRVSAFRQALLKATSMTKYENVFDMFRDADGADRVDESELDYLKSAAAKNSLIVVYYSSTPSGLGAMYWAPAIFGERNCLRFTDPERLVLDDAAATSAATRQPIAPDPDPDAFGVGERPITPTRLRQPPTRPAEA